MAAALTDSRLMRQMPLVETLVASLVVQVMHTQLNIKELRQ